MATIHQARRGVVSLLYAYDLGNDNLEELKNEYFEERKIRNRQREFAEALLK
ncbi:MAG TPA: N utilization substance protein B, partial [Campylobacterales bacterium]|nr:N utilization substance protein B [Campylobacterales bacterium]